MNLSSAQLKLFQQTPTPFYAYDLNLLTQTLESLTQEANKYNYIVHYAVKANSNEKILRTVKKFGLGADCVSGNEVKRAIACGFEPNHIAFAGVGKTDNDIRFAVEQNIFSLNVESIQEIEVINEIAKSLNKTANIALRINPDVNAKTHKYITTGLEENKFGINIWELETIREKLERCNHISLKGLHFHIGSQITDLTPFKNLCTRVNEIQQWFIEHKISIEHINVGGGLGVNYQEPDSFSVVDFKAYFSVFNEFLELQPNQEVHFELGRAIVANCGSLISKVLYVKNGIKTNFAILDAGMTELIRPALYQSYHKIENITPQANEITKYDVVGPICESSDCFGKAVDLPVTQRGDLIAIRTTGAYGEVMASFYNLREKAEVVYY